MGASRAQIEDVYRLRYAAFVGALGGVCGSTDVATEVVQDAFAQALARREQFRREGPLEAWVWKIAIRKAAERRGWAADASLDDVPEFGLPDPARDLDLDRALRNLPPRRRLFVFLHYVADLSYPLIAEICGVSEGTVAAALAQARTSLAEDLAMHNLDDLTATGGKS